jgi:Fic-DOC domain mobile mystery protein B
MIDDPQYIDGQTPLDPEDLEGIKHPHVMTRGELDQLEQANIEEGLRWLARQRSPDLLSDDFARKLHRKLFGEVWSWAGTYRQTEKNIGINPLQIAAQLRTLLDDARFWAEHGAYPPVEAAVRFHHRLVVIHPFANGNGRFSRIMADAYLEDVLEADPIDWGGGYDLQAMNERREQYIAALRAADAGDYSLLFEFVGHTG